MEKYRSLFRHEHWNIGIVNAPIHVFLESDPDIEVKWLPTTGGRNVFRADPFGIVKDGKLTVFFEEFDYRSPKGYISCMELSEELEPVSSRVIFDRSYHLSYPYLFEHEGEIFCVPEASEAGLIQLFQAQPFPDTWKPVTVIAQKVPALDPTVFHHQGLWWIAYTSDDYGHNDNLFLHYSRSLEGAWTPHPGNPVKTDACSSRPAGTPFVHSGSLYRPAQDCSEAYGGRVIINRVLSLTPDEFREEPAAVVEPLKNGPYRYGLHTLSAVGDMTLIDGKRHLLVWSVFLRRVRKRLGLTA